MKGLPHLWQRHPEAMRGLAVAVLALLAVLAAAALNQIGSDPWLIVAIVALFAIIARWTLEHAGIAQQLREVGHALRWLLRLAVIMALLVWAFLKFPIWR
jgi:hypothetical protein